MLLFMLAFMQRLVRLCLKLNVKFFVENPDGSWMWRQIDELSWQSILDDKTVGDLRLDFCRFGTAWRKRTKFRSNTQLKGLKIFCKRTRPHVKLRGRCKKRKVAFTKLAEPYPRGVCRLLALGLLVDSGKLGKCRKLDAAACARCASRRIGEASNPGPRVPRRVRPNIDLGGVELLEPATIAIRSRVMQRFLAWFNDEYAGNDFSLWASGLPPLAISVLVQYGHNSYNVGDSLHDYRQLLAHLQREYVQLRPFMMTAWETVSRWELMEPTEHRPPLPEPLLHAMASIGIGWHWQRWTAVLLGCFYAVCRVGEFLAAKRQDILTPRDVLAEELVIYLRIALPKTRRRGASIQYATIDEPSIVPFLCSVWDELSPEDLLYGGSPGAFRSRWDAVLRHIGVERSHRLTPGSLRGGGAVAAHKRGVPIADLLWKMRLQHQRTLSFYLQETTALSVLPGLSRIVRERVQFLRDALPLMLQQHQRGPAAHNQCTSAFSRLRHGCRPG